MKRRERREEFLARLEREKLDLVRISNTSVRQMANTCMHSDFQEREKFEEAEGKPPTTPREERYIALHFYVQ